MIASNRKKPPAKLIKLVSYNKTQRLVQTKFYRLHQKQNNSGILNVVQFVLGHIYKNAPSFSKMYHTTDIYFQSCLAEASLGRLKDLLLKFTEVFVCTYRSWATCRPTYLLPSQNITPFSKLLNKSHHYGITWRLMALVSHS